MKIIVLTDFHLDIRTETTPKERKVEFADILLLRAIHRINRYLKPDLVLVLGDIVNDADLDRQRKMKELMELLEMPNLIIPGNHDGDPEKFFEIYPELPEFLDIGGCRIIPFIDPERPDFNAFRETMERERMISLSSEFSGPVITCHHVPIFSPGTVECPYNYTNADTVVREMTDCGVNIAIAGHLHAGFMDFNQPFGISIAAPALCESPFKFLELQITGKNPPTVITHSLRAFESLQLYDFHIHSGFAYCNENMDFQKTIECKHLFNISGISFTEHTSHLYFSKEDYYSLKAFQGLPEDWSSLPGQRMHEFRDQLEPFRNRDVLFGLEADCNFDGKPVISTEDRQDVDILIGALHALPPEYSTEMNLAITAFKKLMNTFVEFPMDILAHPFRVFKRSDLPTPEELFPFVVNLLKGKNIAVELNFHTNEPSEKFFGMCLEENIPIALGSDSHNLYEIGEFYPHLELLKNLGITDELDKIQPIQLFQDAARRKNE